MSTANQTAGKAKVAKTAKAAPKTTTATAKAAKPAKAKAPRAAAPSGARAANGRKPAARAAAKSQAAAVKPPKAPKPAKPAKPAKVQTAAEAPKPPKAKLVRDSFTMPKSEYVVIDALKQRSAQAGRPLKKSEVLRAGVTALAAMADADFAAAISNVQALKTGRPKTRKAAEPETQE